MFTLLTFSSNIKFPPDDAKLTVLRKLGSIHGVRITGGALTYVASVALFGGLRLLSLAEFVRYNRAAIGGPSKRQPMNSLL